MDRNQWARWTEIPTEQLAARILLPSVLDEVLFSGIFLLADSPAQSQRYLNSVHEALTRGGCMTHRVHARSLVDGDAKLVLSQLKVPQRFDATFAPETSAISFADAARGNCDQTTHPLVLAIDEADLLLRCTSGEGVLRMLKATRDAINLVPYRMGRLLILGTLVSLQGAKKMTFDRRAAFYGAMCMQIVSDFY